MTQIKALITVASLLVICSLVPSTYAIISDYQVVDVSLPYAPSHVFYFNDTLYATLDLVNSTSQYEFAKIVRYYKNLTIDNSTDLPIPIFNRTSRSVRIFSIEMLNDTLHMLIGADMGTVHFHWAFFTFNLTNMTITSEKYSTALDAMFPPTTYIPGIGNSSYVTSLRVEFDRTYALITTRNLSANIQSELSQISSLKSIHQGVGVNDTHNETILFVCAEHVNGTFFIAAINGTNYNVTNTTLLNNSSCPITIFNNETQTLISVFKGSHLSWWTHNVSRPLPKKVAQKYLAPRAYATNLLANGDYMFVAAQESEVLDKTTIYQYDLVSGLEVDSFVLPHEYRSAPNKVNPLSYYATNNRQFSMILQPRSGFSNYGFIVVNFK